MNHINIDTGKDLAGEQRDPALLHIYSQYTWHDAVEIVGNRAGLEKLRDAINAALAGDNKQQAALTPASDAVFVNDGEGYQVLVIRCDAPWRSEKWTKLIVPYMDEMTWGDRENVDDLVSAIDLLSKEDKDRLYPNRDKQYDKHPLSDAIESEDES